MIPYEAHRLLGSLVGGRSSDTAQLISWVWGWIPTCLLPFIAVPKQMLIPNLAVRAEGRTIPVVSPRAGIPLLVRVVDVPLTISDDLAIAVNTACVHGKTELPPENPFSVRHWT